MEDEGLQIREKGVAQFELVERGIFGCVFGLQVAVVGGLEGDFFGRFGIDGDFRRNCFGWRNFWRGGFFFGGFSGGGLG